jgi:hypothetical protein
VEELGLLAFKGMPDELQDPSHNEQRCAINPERVKKNGGSQERERKHDQRNAQAMANPVYEMSVAARVLRDPLFLSASAQHAGIIPRGEAGLRRNFRSYCGVSRKILVGPAWTWLSAVTS